MSVPPKRFYLHNDISTARRGDFTYTTIFRPRAEAILPTQRYRKRNRKTKNENEIENEIKKRNRTRNRKRKRKTKTKSKTKSKTKTKTKTKAKAKTKMIAGEATYSENLAKIL